MKGHALFWQIRTRSLKLQRLKCAPWQPRDMAFRKGLYLHCSQLDSAGREERKVEVGEGGCKFLRSVTTLNRNKHASIMDFSQDDWVSKAGLPLVLHGGLHLPISSLQRAVL